VEDSLSLEQGAYPAFGIGVPLAIWGFMSYLRGNARTKRENESSSSAKQERKVKKYTSDGRAVQ
jgi:hypothetical protein